MALTINGTNSNDTIIGTSADELIYGYQGEDTIDGGILKDTIYGGKNADTILGNDGYDFIYGDTGDDTIDGGKGEDTLSGGEGNDFLYGNTGSDSINGGKGNDSVNGGDGQDTIYGDTGNDIIDGGAGYDSLIGGDGNDVIFGAGGFDTIDGGKNDDILYGNEGNDLVLGQSGNDLVFGGTGSDTLQGQSGDDSIYGEQGSDLLQGGEGNDLLVGDDGSINGTNLIVNGSFEDSQLGSGWTVFTSINGWTHTLGAGIEVEYGNTAGLLPSDGDHKVELDSHNNSNMIQSIATGEGSFSLTFDYSGRPGVGTESNPIEVYWNGQLIDTLTTDTAGWTTHSYDVTGAGETTNLEFRAVGTNDSLGGFIDNVKLFNAAGNGDTLEGAAGNDTLSGGLGNDSLSGGAGNDILAGGTDNGSIEVSTTISSNFISSNAGWSNSYGFYTTDNSGNPVSGTIIWSNVHGATPDFSTVIAGLGDNMGFFILENGATNAGLSNGDAVNFQNIDGNWVAFKGDTELQTAENAVFFSDETLNSDNIDHDIEVGCATGWEDLLGGGDNDYNDVVVISGIDTNADLHGGDTLIGGEGQDIFSYQVGVDGADKIRDFTVYDENSDTLRLTGITSSDVHFTDVNGNSTLVTFSGFASDGILLTGVNAEDVAAHTIYA